MSYEQYQREYDQLLNGNGGEQIQEHQSEDAPDNQFAAMQQFIQKENELKELGQLRLRALENVIADKSRIIQE